MRDISGGNGKLSPSSTPGLGTQLRFKNANKLDSKIILGDELEITKEKVESYKRQVCD